jgi:GLPGLI family protein
LAGTNRRALAAPVQNHCTMTAPLSLGTLLVCLTLSSLAQQIVVEPGRPMPRQATYITLDHYFAEVIYQLDFQPDSTDAGSRLQEAMVLHLGPQVSRFMSQNALRRQQAVREVQTWGDMNRLLAGPNTNHRSAFRAEIFHNHPEGKLTTHDRVFMDSFEYHEPLYPFSWELTGLTDSIEGHAVQQARTTYGGRQWLAWFAPALPFGAGPYKFGGLPGLILKVHDSRNHYVFTLEKTTAFESPGAIEVSDTRRLHTSRERFWQAWQRFQEDAVNITREFIIDPAPGTEQTIERNMRRRNNPIELRPD